MDSGRQTGETEEALSFYWATPPSGLKFFVPPLAQFQLIYGLLILSVLL